MTWTKLGDEFTDECWRLSLEARCLHVDGQVWSNRKHLDGRLPKERMGLWTQCEDAAPELVVIGFWEDCGDYYQIVHDQAA
jgi:hypothetical protein